MTIKTSPPAAVLLDAGSLHPSDLDLTTLEQAVGSLVCHEHTPPELLVTRLQEADIALTNKVTLDRRTLIQLPRLKLIVVLATGVNNVDLNAARERDIDVCNNVGYATESLVEHTLALILALARQLTFYHQAVREGVWAKSRQFCLLQQPPVSLKGKQIGIIGAGNSGRALATIVRGLGMRTVAMQSGHSISPSTSELPRLPLPELLGSSDVISIHCPLTESTRDLIAAQQLAQMKPGALLVNTARGGIVNETALAQALLDGHLGGAAVDVLTEEPPVAGNPLLDVEHPNLIITPHNAWGSREARQALINQSAEIIKGFRQGRLKNCVNLPSAQDHQNDIETELERDRPEE